MLCICFNKSHCPKVMRTSSILSPGFYYFSHFVFAIYIVTTKSIVIILLAMIVVVIVIFGLSTAM